MLTYGSGSMVIKAVIFDMDGVLIQRSLDYDRIRSRVLRELVKAGIPPEVLEREPTASMMIQRARGYLAAAHGEKVAREAVSRALKAAEEIEEEAVPSAEPTPGIQRVLAELGRLGLRVIVLTNSGRGNSVKALTRAGILELIDRVYTRDDVSEMKPSSRALLELAEREGLKPEEMLMVGDSPVDVMAAMGAGVPIVGFAYTERARERLSKYGVKLIRTPEELLAEVRRMLNVLKVGWQLK